MPLVGVPMIAAVEKSAGLVEELCKRIKDGRDCTRIRHAAFDIAI